MTHRRTSPYWRTFDGVATAVSRRRVRDAFAGALALSAHGYERSTVDVDFLVSPAHRERLLRGLEAFSRLEQDDDTRLVYRQVTTGVEIDVLVAFHPISLTASNNPTRRALAGRRVPVVDSTSLAALKSLAAVDAPALEPKQRGDLAALVRLGLVETNDVTRLLLGEAGAEYAQYFAGSVRHVRSTTWTPPRRRPLTR